MVWTFEDEFGFIGTFVERRFGLSMTCLAGKIFFGILAVSLTNFATQYSVDSINSRPLFRMRSSWTATNLPRCVSEYVVFPL